MTEIPDGFHLARPMIEPVLTPIVTAALLPLVARQARRAPLYFSGSRR
jgi:hypothetical protein